MKRSSARILGALMAVGMLASLVACGGGGGSAGGDSGTFPSNDITLVVPYAAGGTTDLMARSLSTQLGQDLGVNVIVQNVEGGGGTTGTSQAVNSDPDGYTLAIPSNGGYLINPVVNEVGYTWETTTPICIVSEIPIAIGVASSSPYETLDDLLAAAGAASGSITYSTPARTAHPTFSPPPWECRPAWSGTTPPTAALPPPSPS